MSSLDLEEAYCDAIVQALLTANSRLLDCTIDDAVHSTREGKRDTLGLDSTPEAAIDERIRRFDKYAVLITEELGRASNPLADRLSADRRGLETFFVSDPTDRSSQLSKFLSDHGTNSDTVREAISNPDVISRWEKLSGGPASVTGSFSALTRAIPATSAATTANCATAPTATAPGAASSPKT